MNFTDEIIHHVYLNSNTLPIWLAVLWVCGSVPLGGSDFNLLSTIPVMSLIRTCEERSFFHLFFLPDGREWIKISLCVKWLWIYCHSKNFKWWIWINCLRNISTLRASDGTKNEYETISPFWTTIWHTCTYKFKYMYKFHLEISLHGPKYILFFFYLPQQLFLGIINF